MDTPEAIPYTTAATLIVAAHAVGVKHGYAAAGIVNDAAAEPAVAPAAPEPEPELAAVVAQLWWTPAGGLYIVDDATADATANRETSGWKLLCSIWRIPGMPVRYQPAYEPIANALRLGRTSAFNEIGDI